MKTSFKLILVALILSLPGAGTALAAEAKPAAKEAEKPAAKEKPVEKAKPAEKEEAPAKRNTYPLYGQVISADATTLTIKGGEGKEPRKFSVNADTVVVKGDQPATIGDIKEGQWVGGKIEKSAEGSDKVVKLNLEVKQKEPKPEAVATAKADTKEEGKESPKPKATPKKKES